MEPLTSDSYRRRLGETFPSVYLTLISVIQGVSLGILATKTFEYVKDPNFIAQRASLLPYSFTSFIIVIVVTLEYNWFIGIFRWPPTILDTILPLSVGASEIAPMFYLTDPANWWLSTGIFSFVGAAAFLNSLWHCGADMFPENARAHRRTKRNLIGHIATAIAGGVLCLAAWRFFLSSMRIQYPYVEDALPILLLAFALTLMWREERFLRSLRTDFGVTS